MLRKVHSDNIKTTAGAACPQSNTDTGAGDDAADHTGCQGVSN